MARVQLALNVSNIDEGDHLLLQAVRHRAGQGPPRVANFAIAEPPLRLVLIEDTAREPGSLNHLGVEVESTEQVAAAHARLLRGRAGHRR